MNIRPFEWRDFPLLHNYRNQGLFLDSTRSLIHGPNLIPLGAFLTFLGPTTKIFTYRCENCSPSETPLIGQMSYISGATYARLSYLAPENAVEMSDLATLLDYMATEAGRQGAFHILADLDESSQVYQLLRRVGFAIYTRQRIWRLDGEAAGDGDVVTWSEVNSSDVLRIRSLYCNVVPGLVQQVEPLPKKNLKGFAYYKKGEMSAYIELKYGRYGIWVQPYVHPDVENFNRYLVHFLNGLPGRRNRPLFVCIRSYQSWLETAIETVGAKPGTQQAVMVRHLSVVNRVKQTSPLPTINGKHVEPTAPVAQIEDVPILEISEIENQPGINSLT